MASGRATKLESARATNAGLLLLLRLRMAAAAYSLAKSPAEYHAPLTFAFVTGWRRGRLVHEREPLVDLVPTRENAAHHLLHQGSERRLQSLVVVQRRLDPEVAASEGAR